MGTTETKPFSGTNIWQHVLTCEDFPIVFVENKVLMNECYFVYFILQHAVICPKVTGESRVIGPRAVLGRDL